MRKYKYTGDTIEECGHVLHRIVAIRDIVDEYGATVVDSGTVGGYIENQECLSQNGTCFVYDRAKVYEGGKVTDDAKVMNSSTVCLYAKVSGCAQVSGSSFLTGLYCHIHDFAKVHNSQIRNSDISGRAIIGPFAEIFGGRYSGDVVVSAEIHDLAERRINDDRAKISNNI